ncbi:MAG: hypothetical protein JST42_01065 [Bacteroidetes bacterium]|nr:hypothetical protein [Bacteroidota bacterium]
MKSLSTAVFGKMMFGVCFVLAAATVSAQSTAAGAGQSENATVKYLGLQEDMIVFNVSYTNPEGNKFQVIVKDQDGTQLYQNLFSDKAFYKQFRLPRADRDRLVFIIRNGKDADVIKTFEVNVSSRMTQEVSVRKF